MPIEPIDLQVLFSRMLDVGRQQAVMNELVSVAQSAQASELVRQAEAQSSSVNETKQSEEVERLKGKGQGRSGSGQAEEEGKGKSGAKKPERRASFQDPELGKNIDITG